MKIIIFILLVSPAVLSQDVSSHQLHEYLQYVKQPTLDPAPARPEPIKRAGYSIRHGDAKSSVQVNLNSANAGSLFHQPESIQLGAEDVSSSGQQFHGIQSSPQQDYFQGQEALVQYQAPKQSYLTDLANKQYLNINPNNAKPDIISQNQPQQQLYNVGYSINIENSAPKLSYRVPMPKNAHSYRQQKLLNAEVITGTNKALVEKPNNYDFAASNVQPSANYIPTDQGKGQYAPNFAEKQSLTKVFADVKNTHGYTWKTLSPNVEISGYHSLNDMSQRPTQAQGFDHAAALGRSQGFDISNVVENGKNQYQSNADSQAYDINKALSEPSPSNAQASTIETADNHAFDTSSINTASSGFSHGLDSSSIVDLKFPTQNSYPSYGGFSSQFKSGDLSFNSSPFKHNLVSSGSNIEFDKSLLDGFYKNYNPLFYQPEVTLPSPNLPKNININLHGASSHQYPSYNLKFSSPPSHFKNSISPPLSNPQLQMINQHYAFVQASEAEGQGQAQYNQGQTQYSQVQNLAPVSDDVKPVTEQQEDSHGQQTQVQQVQQVAVQVPNNPNFKEQKGKGNTEHKKYNPQGSPVPIPVRQYGRPVIYVNDKNYRMKTNLRPPPMFIIHQKY